MRDPVDRIWSHIRMKARRHPDQFTRSTEDELLAAHAEAPYERRTRYHQTLAALSRSFDPGRVHVGLYEQLFADAEQVRRISRLVGITPREPRLRRTSNSAPRAVDTLPEHVARPVAEHYAHVYREVARARPDLDIARWWPHSRWVL